MSNNQNPGETPEAGARAFSGEALCEFQHHEHGIRSIIKINAIAEIKEAELEAGTREERQREIATALKKPIRIFPHEGPPSSDTYLPLPRWFKHRTHCMALFPPQLDSELIVEDDTRFGRTDNDVRQLVEAIAELFKTNITAYLHCKLTHLRRAMWGEQVPSLLLFAILIGLRFKALDRLSTIAEIGIVVIAVSIWIVSSGFWFWRYRHEISDIYANYYLTALKSTGFKTSEFISGRLNSLSNRFEEYVGKIDSLLPRGEQIDSIDPNKRDSNYKNSKVFWWTQMLMWLPARVERIESLLRYKMALMSLAHAEADYHSFVAIRWMRFRHTLVPATFLIQALVALIHPWQATFSPFFVVMCLLQIVFAAAAIAYLAYIALLAYYKKEWNTPKYVFKEFLDTEQWFGSQKYNLSTRIPARVAKAFAEIDHKDKQIGKTLG